jgi:hypothetical protein
MNLDEFGSQDEVDRGMSAIYRQLDEHVSNADVRYDVGAGLEQLLARMKRERSSTLPTAMPTLGEPHTVGSAVSVADRSTELDERSVALLSQRGRSSPLWL